jgi:hypothetical protein
MATQQTGGITMKTTIKYLGPLLAAAVIGGATGVAPVAIADPGPTAFSQTKTIATPAPSPGPARTPFQTGTDPLVPANVGADPYVPDYPGMDLAF